MNFTEAAEEVLRLVGKPLHYKRITEIAIERNLLSHVGKTPDITMSARLATMAKKDRGDAPIYKIKPGVFALREFSEDVIDIAMKDDSNLEAEVDEQRTWVQPHTRASRNGNGDSDAPVAERAEAKEEDTEVRERLSMPGADVFPEEADDDDLIFSDMGEGGVEGRAAGAGAGQGSANEGGPGQRPGPGAGPGRARRRRGGRRNRDRRDRDFRPSTPQKADNGGQERSQFGADRAAPQEEGQPESRVDYNGEAAQSDTGENESRASLSSGQSGRSEQFAGGLSDAAVRVLSARGRRPLNYQAIAADLISRGRLRGSAAALAPTLAAAVRGENARRQSEGRQPRFRERNGVVGLTHWDVPGEVARAEKDAEHAARRQREQARNAFLRRVRSLPDAGFLELLATWLNAEGVNGISGIAADVGDYALRGLLRKGAAEYPIGVAIFRGNTPVDRSHVSAIRAAREQFGNAQELWIVTLGQAKNEARQESTNFGGAPCTIYDGVALARAVEKVGVGLRRFYIPLTTLDATLLDSLGGGSNESTVESFDEDQPQRSNNLSRRRRRGRRPRFGSRDERSGEPSNESEDASPVDNGEEDRFEESNPGSQGEDHPEIEFKGDEDEKNSRSPDDDSEPIF